VDPYCIVSFKKSILKMMSADKQGRFQSRILENTMSPVWNEEFILHPTKPETDVIVVKVYDRDRSGKKDTLLGKVNLPIGSYWNKGMIDQWFPLTTTLSKTGHGELHLLINYNESGQMKTASGMDTGMGQGVGMTGMSGMPTSNMSNISTTTTSNMPGANLNTGSAFQSQPTTTPTGFVSTSANYPPPVGSHGTSNTKM
jgi:Ca2+-dependent lipid-binding protein